MLFLERLRISSPGHVDPDEIDADWRNPRLGLNDAERSAVRLPHIAAEEHPGAAVIGLRKAETGATLGRILIPKRPSFASRRVTSSADFDRGGRVNRRINRAARKMRSRSRKASPWSRSSSGVAPGREQLLHLAGPMKRRRRSRSLGAVSRDDLGRSSERGALASDILTVVASGFRDQSLA